MRVIIEHSTLSPFPSFGTTNYMHPIELTRSPPPRRLVSLKFHHSGIDVRYRTIGSLYHSLRCLDLLSPRRDTLLDKDALIDALQHKLILAGHDCGRGGDIKMVMGWIEATLDGALETLGVPPTRDDRALVHHLDHLVRCFWHSTTQAKTCLLIEITRTRVAAWCRGPCSKREGRHGRRHR